MPKVRMLTHIVGQDFEVLPGDVLTTDQDTAQRLVDEGAATWEPGVRETMMRKLRRETAVEPEAVAR